MTTHQARRITAACLLAILCTLRLFGCATGKPATATAAGRRVATSRPAMSHRADERTDEHLELPEDARLRDCLAFAALNNAGLRASFHEWHAALARLPQAAALPDPRFTYRVFIEEVETRVGPQRQSWGVSQTFPWLGKLTERKNVASEAAEAACARYEAEKFRLFYRVTSAWYEYYYLARAIDVVRQNVELMRQFEHIALTRYKVGTLQKPDVIRAQVELGKLDDRLRTLQEMRSPVAARMNAALNRESGAALPWPPTAEHALLALADAEILAAIPDSPEIRALSHEVDKERNAVELARQDYFPDLTFGVEVIDTGPARTPGISDSGKDPVIATLSVNVPVWHEVYRAREREALQRHLAALSTRTERENRLTSDVKMALFAYHDAERRIALYRDTLIPKSEESIRASESAFRTGGADFLDLVDSERILLEFQLSLERATADRAQELAKLEMLVGKRVGAPEASESAKP